MLYSNSVIDKQVAEKKSDILVALYTCSLHTEHYSGQSYACKELKSFNNYVTATLRNSIINTY